MTKGRKVNNSKLLWVGDAVAHTGFATVTHGVLDGLKNQWDVHVLGINYRGDPHEYDYSIYPASTGGDAYGIGRIKDIVQFVNPDVICMLNDPWIITHYVTKLREAEFDLSKIAVYTPIDAKNIAPDYIKNMNDVGAVISYTQFGIDEMRKSGLSTYSQVIPHGFDKSVFHPVPRSEVQSKIRIPDDWFIVGNVNRNQQRKRLDLTIMHFAEWVKDKPDNVKLYLHCSLHDVGWNIVQLADYYGIGQRLIITSKDISPSRGIPKDMMKYIYSSFDVQISTTQGEGWGLTQMEGMACKVPQVIPDYSGLGDWARDGAYFVPVTSYAASTNNVNTVGGIVDHDLFIEALDNFYYNRELREEYAEKGYNLVHKKEFEWKNVSSKFHEVLSGLR